MPNWCSTTYWITGDEKEIKVLADAFEKAKANADSEAGFCKGWLGHLLMDLGLGEKSARRLCGRAYIPCLRSKPVMGVWEFSVISRCEPCHEPIKLMCEKYAPNADVKYLSEDAQDEVYLTNHPAYMDRYLISSTDEELADLNDSYVTKEKLVETLQELLGTTESDLDELFSAAGDAFMDIYTITVEYAEF